jgi:3-methyladenine DNA glycosylase AlkD
MNAITPAALAQKAVHELEKMANPERALQVQHYFKEKVRFYGLNSQEMRQLAKTLYQEIKTIWTVEQAISFCEELFRNPHQEARGLGILVLTKYKKNLPCHLPHQLHAWAYQNYLDNWALVDVTFPDLMGAHLLQHPEDISILDEWARSTNRWVRRASIVSLLKLTKKREFHGDIYRIASGHFNDQDDLIQKANGWLLREVGKSDMQKLEGFLRENGPGIPRTTLRYAIERFEEKRRKSILVESRGPR